MLIMLVPLQSADSCGFFCIVVLAWTPFFSEAYSSLVADLLLEPAKVAGDLNQICPQWGFYFVHWKMHLASCPRETPFCFCHVHHREGSEAHNSVRSLCTRTLTSSTSRVAVGSHRAGFVVGGVADFLFGLNGGDL